MVGREFLQLMYVPLPLENLPLPNVLIPVHPLAVFSHVLLYLHYDRNSQAQQVYVDHSCCPMSTNSFSSRLVGALAEEVELLSRLSRLCTIGHL